MNQNTKIGIGVIALLLVVTGAYAAFQKNDVVVMDTKNDMTSIEASEEKMMMEKKAMEEKEKMESDNMMQKDSETMMNKDESMTDKPDETTMMKKGVYEAYTPEKLVRAETGDVVLFFHASWCPSCRGLNADIEQNLDAIPAEVSILKVDYDKESELKKKYGITYQHTLVQVDANGTLINKWSGSPTLAGLVAEIQ